MIWWNSRGCAEGICTEESLLNTVKHGTVGEQTNKQKKEFDLKRRPFIHLA